jgi:mycothiol S-conjugate amidase
LLAVHAHPDDESSKGAATVVRYHRRGVRCVLVSCTGGEAGQMLDAEVLDASGHGGDLAARRSAELQAAVEILGYETTYRLGYRDSGMDVSVPGGFATVDLDLVVTELLDVFQRERPDVVVTYDPHYAARHPDHQRCYDATRAAFDAAPPAPWRPVKLYGCRTHSPAKVRAMHEWLTSCGQASPYRDALTADTHDETTTRIAVGDELAMAQHALRAHGSQVAADDPWFFSVPLAALREIYPYEDYVLMHSRVPIVRGADGFEHDLFSGVADLVIR